MLGDHAKAVYQDGTVDNSLFNPLHPDTGSPFPAEA
jgi:hypothetical protein